MKKVLIFIPEFPVISETFIERDISKLIELGNLDITVLYIKKGNGEMSENVREKAVEHRLNFADAFSGLKYFVTKSDKVREVFELSLNDNSQAFPLKIFTFLKSLGYARIFSKYQPDEIHAHFLSIPSTLAMFAAHILGVQFSVSGHAKDILVNPSLLREKAHFARFIAVCNKNAYNKAIELAGSNNKIHMINHGVDPQKIFPASHVKESSQAPAIFLGGTRLVEKKGIIHMIEASRILKERGIAHRVEVAGSGKLYDEFVKKISEYALENNFYIHGGISGVPFKEVAKMYLNADIFVYPGIVTEDGDADGIPNVLIEAAFAKLPIITTNAGSISEFLNSDNAIIVPQKDTYALADSIERLIFDESMRRMLGERAYAKASEMFDVERNVKQLEALLLQ